VDDSTHLTALELESALADALTSPSDRGTLQAIIVRPQEGARQSLAEAELSAERGIHGDRWHFDHWRRLPDGSSDPQAQVSFMNSRVLQTIAGSEDAMSLAGDNLLVDLDLSAENLPAGTQLKIGAQVVIEISAEKHTGCWKFSQRYGADAKKFVNHPDRKRLHLRGRYGRIIEGGTIQVGDIIVKLSS